MATERIVIYVSEKGSRTVRREIEGIGVGATRAQGAVQLLSRALLAIGVGAGLGAVVRTLANFSQEMSSLKAISGATEQQFQALREEAKRLGAETRYSASQAAAGMGELARAGFTVEQVLASTSDVLSLAQGQGIGLAQAASIASITLNGFRLSAADAGRVADVLATAADRTNSSVVSLGDGMAYVAPIAAGLGVDLEEAVAAMGALSDAGLQGSMAGTGLRQVLSELENPSNKTIGILKELGLTASDVRVSQVGLTAALQKLADAGVGAGTALQIFGDRGGPAFEVLSNAIPKVRELTDALADSEGYAAEVAAIMDDNLNGALLGLQSSVEALVISFGDLGAEGALTSLFRGLADAIRYVAANLEKFAEASMAFLPLLARVVAGPVIGAFKALAVVLLANPITLIAVAVSAAVAALIYFRDQIRLSGEGLATLGDLAAVTWTAIVSGLTAVVEWFVVAWRTIFGGAEEAFSGVEISFQSVLEFLAGGVDTVVGFFLGAYNAIVVAWGNLPAAFLEIAQAALNGAVAVVETGINFIIGAINGLLEGVGLEGIDSVALGRVSGAGTALGEAFKEGLEYTGASDALADLIGQANERAALRATQTSEEGALTDPGVPSLPGQGTGLTDPIETGGLGGGGGGSGASASFGELITQMEREGELLRLNNEDRMVRQELLQFEDELGRALTATEAAMVEELVLSNEQLRLQSEILQGIRGPQEDLQARQQALNALFAQGKITVDEYNASMRGLRVEMTEVSNSFGGGIENGLARIAERANELGKGVSDWVVGAFDSATNAIVEFAKTGEFNINQFFGNLFAQLLELATQQLFSQLVGMVLGGLGGGGGGAGGFLSNLLGFKTGGSMMVGGSGGPDSQLMMFKASPGERVDVSTPAQQAAKDKEGGGRDTPVNVKVVNVTDPRESLAAIDTAEGERVIMNVIERNPATVRRLLGAS